MAANYPPQIAISVCNKLQ